jgi:hypothetical protein
MLRLVTTTEDSSLADISFTGELKELIWMTLAFLNGMKDIPNADASRALGMVFPSQHSL